MREETTFRLIANTNDGRQDSVLVRLSTYDDPIKNDILLDEEVHMDIYNSIGEEIDWTIYDDDLFRLKGLALRYWNAARSIQGESDEERKPITRAFGRIPHARSQLERVRAQAGDSQTSGAEDRHDYYAGMALQGMICSLFDGDVEDHAQEFARKAHKIARIMEKERSL